MSLIVVEVGTAKQADSHQHHDHLQKRYVVDKVKDVGMVIAVSMQAIDGIHRLQLSRNLRDSPGFLEFVPGPGRT